jgi:hypothetical protein
MVDESGPELITSQTSGAMVHRLGLNAWRLEIPAGPAGRYRLAQLDDYRGLRRGGFRWRPPLRLVLQARAGAPTIPGTWGFGLWNDPFGMGILSGTDLIRLPVLPNTAWFFFASPPNDLSLRDDLPARGALAATFRSPQWPGALSLLAVPVLPLLALPPLARLLRRLAGRVVQQDTALLFSNQAEWHCYEMAWREEEVQFWVDGVRVLQTAGSPRGRLGLVLWVDNQYAAIPPSGRLRYGTLANPEPAWIEIRDFVIGHF